MKIFLSVGEASGELHASHLVQAIRKMDPHGVVTCMGGPALGRTGAEVLVDYRAVSVVGLLEVAKHLRAIHLAWRRLMAYLSTERPDLVILIDFPDFNLLLARAAKKMGLKVFYYIGPQVWAWRKGRVKTIKRHVDEMAVILPFEEAFYARCGMRVTYVGHPLLDVLKEAPTREIAEARYRPDETEKLIGLLPGSRRSELGLLLDIMLDAAAVLHNRVPGVSFLLPVAPSLHPGLIEPALRGRKLPVRLVTGDTHGVIKACDLILTVSGTTTLEAAILNTPMIIVNRLSRISYLLGRPFIRVNCVGLPNLIAGRMVVPELLQDQARPQAIADAAVSFLQRPELLNIQKEELRRVRNSLGSPGVAERVARLALATAVRQQGKTVRKREKDPSRDES